MLIPVAVKYVALLAFKNIVRSYPELVALHQDVILDCIDDPDISIRLQALDLGSGMINIDNISLIVERLMQQLRDAPLNNDRNRPNTAPAQGIEPAADSDEEDPEARLRPDDARQEDSAPLPDEYRTKIILKILEMCAKKSYANIPDFEWYVDILLELVRLAPSGAESSDATKNESQTSLAQDVAVTIGTELRNVGVRVSAVRTYVVQAAYNLIAIDQRYIHFPAGRAGAQSVLAYASWIVGEYASLLPNKRQALDSLLLLPTPEPHPPVLAAYIQAIAKVLSSIFLTEMMAWGPEQQTMASLLLARVIHFLEPRTTHSNLEVQERAVEFLELFKLTSDAVKQDDSSSDGPPILLTRVIPSLFNGAELGPVAAGAQRRVPLPENVDLSVPLNSDLPNILQQADQEDTLGADFADSYAFYYEKPVARAISAPTAAALVSESSSSYQNTNSASAKSEARVALKAELRRRQRDDPFYIGREADDLETGDPISDILQASSIDELEIDAIPIMALNLESSSSAAQQPPRAPKAPLRQHQRQQMVIAAEETIGDEISPGGLRSQSTDRRPEGLGRARRQQGLLQVDSSGLRSMSLTGESHGDQRGVSEYERVAAEENEMAKALAEVERLRIEMQRASEQLHLAEGMPDDGTVVKKKKKKVKKRDDTTQDPGAQEASQALAVADVEAETVVKKKRRRKKMVSAIE